MLNEDYKSTAINNLEKANMKYTRIFHRTINDMDRLLKTRQKAVQTIRMIENYIILLANKPREYEQRIGKIKMRYIAFNNRIDQIKKLEVQQNQIHSKSGAGIMAGIGTATFAPTAAMAVAMTFGTASTGTAISSLSGVAATNAALAWLGGGTVAVGGAGIAGGRVLLSMAGPIGWAVGGISIASGLLMQAISNKQIAQKAENAAKVIIRETERICETDVTIRTWEKETCKLFVELKKKLTLLRRKKDYMFFTEDDKNELIILMNMTEVLSKKIGETIHAS